MLKESQIERKLKKKPYLWVDHICNNSDNSVCFHLEKNIFLEHTVALTSWPFMP